MCCVFIQKLIRIVDAEDMNNLHTTFRAWRIADSSIPSAGTVVAFLFKVEDKIFC
jgi:hypothetical protein